MIHALKFAVVAMIGTALGQAISPKVGLLADATVQQIRDSWTVDLRTVVAVGTVVVLGAWRVSRWQQRLDDRLQEMEKQLNSLPCSKNGCKEDR